VIPFFKKRGFGNLRGGDMAFQRKRLLTLSGPVFLVWLLAGCASPEFMVKSMDPLMDRMNTSVNRSPDVDMIRDSLPATLVQLDGFIDIAPSAKLLLRAAEANFGYSFAFVEDVDKERASFLYLKARDYALKPLMLNDEFRGSLRKPVDKFKKSLDGFWKSEAPALYWAANSWMAYTALNLDKTEALMDIPKIEAMLLRVVELDETYYYGSAHASLGAFYASRSKVIGGDPDKAKYHFDRAFEISGSRLLFIHLLYAKYYAYQIQDRALFEETLRKVIDAPVDLLPEKNFANEVAKRKARALLNDVDLYF